VSWNITRVYICVHNRIYKRDIVSKTPKYIADIIILFTKYLRSIFTPLLSDWPNASNCVVSYDQLFKLSSLWGKTIFFPVYVLFGVLSQHNLPVFTSMSVGFEWIFFLSNCVVSYDQLFKFSSLSGKTIFSCLRVIWCFIST